MKSINYLITELCNYAEQKNLIEACDRAYSTSSLMALFGLDVYSCERVDGVRELNEILADMCSVAYERGIIESTSVGECDLFDTKIMGLLTPRPSEFIRTFWDRYRTSPKAATDYFYSLACDSNYIRCDRIKRDVKWTYRSEYGDIDITINLSKPEKDPRDIARAAAASHSDYPKCLLCHENEGFAGNAVKPARQTLRQLPVTVGGDSWYLQYSPYVYYNEHCILLADEHIPMLVNRRTFERQLDFVTTFPHYFMGSNAGLPIVGGSILSHDHMQGGRYEFPMERAGVREKITIAGYEDVQCCIVDWPMSVIRIRHSDKSRVLELADYIFTSWQGYTDESAYVFAVTDGEAHNAITPISRRRGEDYEMDLVLRNNITTPERPDGLYHAHPCRHNIKRENIGLIEVMGLAVLPSRLVKELELLSKAILGGEDFSTDGVIGKHWDWYKSFCDEYTFTEENVISVLKEQIGKTFTTILSDAGVFKDTPDGRASMLRFVNNLNSK